MRLLPASAHRRMPWKNGGGDTIEIAIRPEGASLDAFDWRVSMASVTSDGPFSNFAGVDRTLAVIEGAGLRLLVDGSLPVTLVPGSDPHGFAGDVPTRAELLDGPIRDLNVMTRRGSWTHRIEVHRIAETLTLPIEGTTTLLFCYAGTVAVGPEGIQLGPGDSVLAEPAPHLAWTLRADDPAAILLITLTDAA